MNNLNLKPFVFFLIIFNLLIITQLGPESVNASLVHSEQMLIEEIIESYFGLRYLAYNTLELGDFSSVVSNSPDAGVFSRRESEKLEIEILHLEQSQLRYTEYAYTLKYVDISIPPDSQVAVVSLIEGHDVVFENDRDVTSSEPLISSMRNLEHLITLQKEDGVWKIVSDEYEDYIWGVILRTGLTKAEYLSFDRDTRESTIPDSVEISGLNNLCSMPDDASTYTYNRTGAVAYAQQWATAPPPYNPKYVDFTVYGGDCTNFVSQAIYEGGGALMVGDGTYGWYFNSIDDYAAAWTGVYYLFKFVTQYTDFPVGPEGCQIPVDQALVGDVIQYSWEGDNYWDHSVMIVAAENSALDERDYWVAGHSPDVDNYPYEYFSIEHPDMVYRFLHIERLDGYRLNLPSVYK